MSIYLATFEPNVYLSQEQMVAKLNVTYLSLLRLGFEKDDIEVALRHTYTGESEDALDWVICQEIGLEDEGSTLPQSNLKLIYSSWIVFTFSSLCLQLCMHLDSEKLPRGFADKLYHEEGKKRVFSAEW